MIPVMAGRIKLFQSVQKYHRTMGIVRLQPNQRWLTFNARNLIFLASFAHLFLITVGFSIFYAKTTMEYGTGYYAYISETGSTTYFLIQMWQINNFFKLIEHFQEFVEKSECAFENNDTKIDFFLPIRRSQCTNYVQWFEWKNRASKSHHSSLFGLGFDIRSCGSATNSNDYQLFLLWDGRKIVLFGIFPIVSLFLSTFHLTALIWMK